LLRPASGPRLAFTVDFITPIVDDAETFGAIAAANALSDVYAMGGEPQVALAICGFPDDKIGLDVLERIFRGGRDKAAEAGCAIVGGHTVIDPELKYGLCVLGSVDPERELGQQNARPGDRLVLTKPLGIGVASQAIKRGELSERDLAVAIASMLRLNRDARDAALAAGAHAATDVTGFGLLGHLHHLLLGAKTSARIRAGAVPVLAFARELAAAGQVPGGTRRNLAYVEPHTHWDPGVDEPERLLLADAQTSGGLLIAVPAEHEASLLAELERRQTLASASIGEIVEGAAGQMHVLGGN
jgi:selenide,water dikinase